MKRKGILIFACLTVLFTALFQPFTALLRTFTPAGGCYDGALPQELVSGSGPSTNEEPCTNEEQTCFLASCPSSRPYAIEEHSNTVIAPSPVTIHGSSPDGHGVAAHTVQRILTSRRSTCNAVQKTGISLPPELIAFPFSSFW